MGEYRSRTAASRSNDRQEAGRETARADAKVHYRAKARTLEGRLHQIYVRAWHTTARWKKKNMGFDLDEAWLRELWESQGGRCAVTRLPFDLRPYESLKRNPYQPSLDRIDSKQGYVKTNVRFVLFAVNIALNEWGLEVFGPIAEALCATARPDNL